MGERAKDFAVSAHGDQLYQGRPYVSAHVAKVVKVLRDYGFAGDWIAAGWLHDVIEDTPVTFDDIKAEFGTKVATMVDACTGIGHNRKARNASIYAKIAAYPAAAPIKLADRIANVEASLHGSSHRHMYMKEADDFEAAIRRHVSAVMWTRLERAYRLPTPTTGGTET